MAITLCRVARSDGFAICANDCGYARSSPRRGVPPCAASFRYPAGTAATLKNSAAVETGRRTSTARLVRLSENGSCVHHRAELSGQQIASVPDVDDPRWLIRTLRGVCCPVVRLASRPALINLSSISSHLGAELGPKWTEARAFKAPNWSTRARSSKSVFSLLATSAPQHPSRQTAIHESGRSAKAPVRGMTRRSAGYVVRSQPIPVSTAVARTAGQIPAATAARVHLDRCADSVRAALVVATGPAGHIRSVGRPHVENEPRAPFRGRIPS